MRVGMPLAYSTDGFYETVKELVDYEAAGLDQVYLPEAYTFDSVSQLGFLAARTSTLTLASGILNVYSRTPALLAMTAAGLDAVSEGRFVLGLGASGPQVVEGFHGVPYAAPLGRTREVIEICRQVWSREPLVHSGPQFDIPLSVERGGGGLGKPLKLINHPVRARIPVVLAALGPKNVALAAELCEGWEPIFYYPEGAKAAFGDALAAGSAKRGAWLPPLEVVADTHVRVSDDVGELQRSRATVRAHLALYLGGMGAKGMNFYNDLAGRYGYADEASEVQELYLSGRKDEAVAALPEALVRGVSLIGTRAEVADRVAAFRDSGVTALNAVPLGGDHRSRLADIACLKDLAS